MRISDWSSDVCSSDLGDPALLNNLCWLRGTREIQLDAVLKDCTRAVELGNNAAAVLDSRAMVFFRLCRLDEARADRSEERRVGKECVSTCRSRWSRYH